MTDDPGANIVAPLRLKLDGGALTENYRSLARISGDAACGAAIKADGYGLGAREVARRLADAGCSDFFVAHWGEVSALSDIVPASRISVLNGFTGSDGAAAIATGARPVLNTPPQIADWKAAGGGQCHVMLDSGINRLGIGAEQIGGDLLDGLDIDILMSHLASADEDSDQNPAQLALFTQMSSGITCNRKSMANSAGIMLGSGYHFDLTRPGLSLYGGIARAEMAEFIKPVVLPEAKLLQVRQLKRGDPVGYNATYACEEDMPVGTIAMGYADGYLRGFSGKGATHSAGAELPVIGRVSMDLVTLDLRGAPDIAEGDWVSIDYGLPAASAVSGLSQYELLTGLAGRFDRLWL